MRFPRRARDRDDRSAGGGDPVELARHDQAFELGPQRNQMDVRNAKGMPQYPSLLIAEEAKQMVEPTLVHRAGELGKLVAAANKEEAEALVVAQALRRGKDRFKLVSPAEVSRIANDEAVSKPPLFAQWIVCRGYGPDFLVIAPVRYDANTFRRDAACAHDLRHAFPNHHIGSGGTQRGVAQLEKAPTERALDKRHTQRRGNLRIEILEPVDEMKAPTSGRLHYRDRQQRRVSLRN